MDTTTLPPRGKLNLHYYLLQIGFWGGIGCFTGFQSVIVLDRGFTSADVGVFVAVCNLAGILFQPQLGAWADRHPEIPLKRIFLCCILTALGLNTVFLFTRPGFLLTALFFALMGMAEVNSFTLIDAMAMQYINAGADLPYSRGRGLGSLAYAL
ncbi:MAG TPA: MFS transporter, partial [Oscillibacter sp.]|nr:MFS transporter [Oscillibacter sp.]